MSSQANYTFKWKIENYSKILNNFNKSFISRTFYSKGFIKWFLRLFPNGCTEHPNHVCCHSESISNTEDAPAHWTFQLMDTCGNAFRTKVLLAYALSGHNSLGTPMITFKKLEKKMKKFITDILTVRCSIAFTNSERNCSLYYENTTKICMNCITFPWRVKEPDSLKWTQSKVFTIAETVSIEVSLTAPDNDILVNFKNKLLVDVESLCVTCKIVLVDRHIHKNREMITTYKIKNNCADDPCGIQTFCAKDILIADKYTENGFITLLIEFMVPNGIVSESDKKGVVYIVSQSKQCNDATTTFQNDFKQLYLNKKYSDVILKVEGKLFPAHKCVLSSRCSMFQKMFDSGMRESKENVVVLNDVDSITLNHLLEFMYSGTLDVKSWEEALNLLVAADKYRVDFLIEKCTHMLETFYSEENILDIIEVADKLNLVFLKQSARFYVENELGVDIIDL